METLSQQRRTAYIRMHSVTDYDHIYWYAIEISGGDSKKEITCKSCGSDVKFPAEVQEGDGSNTKVFYRVSEPEYALRIHPISDHEFLSGSSWCVVASTIYNLGCSGHHSGLYSREVCYLDTNGPEVKWERGPSMINGRDSPFVTVLGGKIYVLGGTLGGNLDHTRPWGEVFDPCLKTWEPLPPAPSEIMMTHFVQGFSIDNMKKIFVRGNRLDVLYSFDVTTKSWQVFYFHGDGGIPFNQEYVVVGTTLYWISKFNCLDAYDLNQQKSFKGRVPLDQVGVMPNPDERESPDPEEEPDQPSLLHLGGEMFCLIWVDNNLKTDYKFYCIRCTKFRASKHDFGELKITLESSTSYLVDGGHIFEEGLLV